MMSGRLRSRSALTRMMRQPRRSSSAVRSMSLARIRGSVQCCAPSYSTPTRHCSQPMSIRASTAPHSLGTTIWVCGLGNPAATMTSLVLVSCGDSAPASTRGSARRSCFIPLAPRCASISGSTPSTVSPVALASESTAITADTSPGRRPRSNAVRAGDVTGTPPTTVASPGSNVSLRVMINDGGRLRPVMSSAGPCGSTHSAPSSAAAELPATTAFLPDHNQAATARSFAPRPLSRW